MKKLFPILVFVSLLSLVNCTKESTCDTSNVTYTNTVKAVFDSKCATSGCHDNGSINESLATYNDIKVYSKLSKLVASINHNAGAVAMPQSSAKLDDCTISKIEAWVAAGKPE